MSIDDLLSGEEVLTIAQEDQRQAGDRMRGLMFGLQDCCALLVAVLPLFGVESDGIVGGALLSAGLAAAYASVLPAVEGA